MQKQFNLEFCFKGNRSYIHGTDIFSKLVEQVGDRSFNIDLVLHGITTNNMSFTDEKPKQKKEIKVILNYQYNEEKIKLFGTETDAKVNCRYAYNEEAIVKNSIVNIAEKNILLKMPANFSFIEHIVAMNKALLENLYTDLEGKWYFTRLQLKKNIPIHQIQSLELSFKSNFNFKLTKTAILVNREEIGFIYFSLVRKDS